MDEQTQRSKIRRRDVLIAVTVSGAAVAVGAASSPTRPRRARRDKRKAQYQAELAGNSDVLPSQSLSGEVERHAIKRTESLGGAVQVSRQSQANSTGNLDRRSFLRRSGLIAGALAGLGGLPLGTVRKAAAGAPPPPGAAVTRRKNSAPIARWAARSSPKSRMTSGLAKSRILTARSIAARIAARVRRFATTWWAIGGCAIR